eukprot:PhM_4_TR12060/c0_g1_i1/m.22105
MSASPLQPPSAFSLVDLNVSSSGFIDDVSAFPESAVPVAPTTTTSAADDDTLPDPFLVQYDTFGQLFDSATSWGNVLDFFPEYMRNVDKLLLHAGTHPRSFRCALIMVETMDHWIALNSVNARHATSIPLLSTWTTFTHCLFGTPPSQPSFPDEPRSYIPSLIESVEVCREVLERGHGKENRAHGHGSSSLLVTPPSLTLGLLILFCLIAGHGIAFYGALSLEASLTLTFVLTMPLIASYIYATMARLELHRKLTESTRSMLLVPHIQHVLFCELTDRHREGAYVAHPIVRDTRSADDINSYKDHLSMEAHIDGTTAAVNVHPFHHSGVLIVCKADFTITYFSGGAQAETGFQASDVVGLSVLSIVGGNCARTTLVGMTHEAVIKDISPVQSIAFLTLDNGLIVVELVAAVCRSSLRVAGYVLSGRVVQTPNVIHRLMENWRHQTLLEVIQRLRSTFESFTTCSSRNDRGLLCQLVEQYILHTQHVASYASPIRVQQLIRTAQHLDPTNVRVFVSNLLLNLRGRGGQLTQTGSSTADSPKELVVRERVRNNVPTYVRLEELRMGEILFFLLEFVARHESKEGAVRLTVEKRTVTPGGQGSLFALDFVIETSLEGTSNEVMQALKQRNKTKTSAGENKDILAANSNVEFLHQLRQAHMILIELGGSLLCETNAEGTRYVVSIPLIPADILVEEVVPGGAVEGENEPTHTLSPMSIILQDDSKVHTSGLSRLLLSARQSISIATSPEDVFDLLSRSPDFQGVFFDVSHKSAIDELPRFSAYPQVTVVLTAEQFNPGDQLLWHREGYLTLAKPTDPQDLFNVLKTMERTLAERKEKQERIGKVRQLLSEYKTGAWVRHELIGKGAFGSVYKAVSVLTSGVMAVKVIPVSSDDEKKSDLIINEISMLHTLEHQHIIHYLYCERAVSDDQHTINIFMEYANGGSLAALVNNNGPLREARTATYLRDILSGVDYLHKKKVIHRDLKAGNILLSDGRCKIGDFQTAVQCEKGSTVCGMTGTIRWMAPEIAKGQRYDHMCDIWSIGCLALELLTGKIPFAHVDATSLQFASFLCTLPLHEDVPFLDDSDQISDAARDFIRSCLQVDPNMRPSAEELLHSAFLTDNNLEARRLQVFRHASSRATSNGGQRLKRVATGTDGIITAEGFLFDSAEGDPTHATSTRFHELSHTHMSTASTNTAGSSGIAHGAPSAVASPLVQTAGSHVGSVALLSSSGAAMVEADESVQVEMQF